MKLSASFLTSTVSFFFLSSSAWPSASSCIFLISSSDIFVVDWIVILASFPVPISFAVTFKIPFASMSNLTLIWGTPLGAGGISVRLKLPRETLSATIGRSPWTTLIVTAVWLSAAVVNVLSLEVGMVVFLSIIGSLTPPSVSIPRVSGVTSSKTISLVTSPAIIPAWTAAPNATASIGSTPDSASFPRESLTNFLTIGIRVGPPIKTIFVISEVESFASSNDLSIDDLHRWTIGFTRSSSFALVIFTSRFFAPDESCAINGRLTSVSITVDNSIFAFSAPSLILVIAVLSLERSIPSFFLNSSTTKSIKAWSISAPPSFVSPEVLITSNTPPPISIIVTSRVPPPKSKTNIFMSSFALSNPNASDAAVGSLIILTTSNPAMVPASFVACRWLSLKYAGTVITALEIVSPVNASASRLIFWRMNAEICWGLYSFPWILYKKSSPIFRFASRIVLSGFVTACLLAGSPTSRSPSFENATTDGNALPATVVPSAAGIKVGLPPWITDAAELLVPKSIPIIFSAIFYTIF